MTAGLLLLTLSGLLVSGGVVMAVAAVRGVGIRPAGSAPVRPSPRPRITRLHLGALAAGVLVLLITGWPVAALATVGTVAFIPKGPRRGQGVQAGDHHLGGVGRLDAAVGRPDRLGCRRVHARGAAPLAVIGAGAHRACGHQPGDQDGTAGRRVGAAAVRRRGRRPRRRQDRHGVDPARAQRWAGVGRGAHRAGDRPRRPVSHGPRGGGRTSQAPRQHAHHRRGHVGPGLRDDAVRPDVPVGLLDPLGQVALLVVVAIFGTALRWMRRLSDPPTPPRILVDPEPVTVDR